MSSKSIPIAVLPLLALSLAWARGGDEPPTGKTEEVKKDSGPEMNALEKKFKEALTNVVFAGKWRLVEKGELGKEADDKYTIAGATKDSGDQWVIAARIEYGSKSVTVPVPVKVLWAGDTPVISITNVGIPGLGTFTARVLVYDGWYTGTWSGPGHGGFLSGVISKAPEKLEKTEKKEAAAPK